MNQELTVTYHQKRQEYGFDHLRIILMICVVMYHVSGTYSSLTPYWPFHDGQSALADFIRTFFDVFMMPGFFFVAGWFTLSSLAKKTTKGFILSKLKRIGIPWLMAILFLIPALRYLGKFKHFQAMGRVLDESLLQNWLHYLFGFGTTKMGFLKGQVSQMHLWFLSMLLVFFILIGVISSLKLVWFEKLKKRDKKKEPGLNTGQALKAAAGFSIGISIIYFCMIKMIPDFSWVTVQLLFQFQPTKLIIYAGYFSLGILMSKYDFSILYNSKEKLCGWLMISAILSVIFLIQAKTMYARIYDSNSLGVSFLLPFSIIKPFLIFSILMVLLTLATLLKNRTSWFFRSLAIQSYYIYIIHVPFVFKFQEWLMKGSDAGPLTKGVLSLVVVLTASYLVSLLINKFPKSFCTIVVFLFFLSAFQTL